MRKLQREAEWLVAGCTALKGQSWDLKVSGLATEPSMSRRLNSGISRLDVAQIIYQPYGSFNKFIPNLHTPAPFSPLPPAHTVRCRERPHGYGGKPARHGSCPHGAVVPGSKTLQFMCELVGAGGEGWFALSPIPARTNMLLFIYLKWCWLRWREPAMTNSLPTLFLLSLRGSNLVTIFA